MFLCVGSSGPRSGPSAPGATAARQQPRQNYKTFFQTGSTDKTADKKDRLQHCFNPKMRRGPLLAPITIAPRRCRKQIATRKPAFPERSVHSRGSDPPAGTLKRSTCTKCLLLSFLENNVLADMQNAGIRGFLLLSTLNCGQTVGWYDSFMWAKAPGVRRSSAAATEKHPSSLQR